MQKKNKKQLYLVYSGLFSLIALFIIVYLLIHGKTNINTASDGMNQHYRAMLYYSRYLKQIVKNLIVQHRLIMPHWDHTIGEGADIISVLHSDAIGDPLTFLSVLIPERFMPLYYLFNTFIRVYLAGLFFIMLCLYLGKKNEFAILAGSMTYAFCYWSLESITHHIYFLTPLMILPLMVLGLEKILDNKEPFTFSLAVTWGAVSWLYFFYMEAACTAIYGFVRVITRYRNDIKTIIIKLSKIAFYALLGIAMAAAILGPMIYSYMNDKRMGLENVVSVLYPPFFYERLLTMFVSNDSAYDLCMGFAAPALFALFLSIKHCRKSFCLFIINVITFFCVCLPMCGKILNGFSFVSQRWSFAIALPVAYTFVTEWDDIADNRRLLSIVWILLSGCAAYSAWSRTERVFVPLLFALLFLVLATSKADQKLLGKELRQILLLGIVILNILYLEQYSLSSRGGDVINDLLSIERAKALPYSSEAYTMKQYIDEKKEGFYRYTGNRQTNNAAMLFNAPSTNSYWSITNSSDQIFRLKLGMQDYICWQINGYDNRAELESLSNVKYYITQKDYDGVLPYGFVYDKQVNNYNIYVNEYVLPFGYTYDNSISYEVWDELDALKKQQVMMDHIVIEKGGNDITYGYGIEELPYTLTCSEGIEFDGNRIVVSEKDTFLSLKFNGKPDMENYLILSGLDYKDIYSVIEDDHTDSIITVEGSNGNVAFFSYLAKNHHYYFGKTDYTAYLGNGEALNEITLSFPLIGEYTFEELKVFNKMMDDYEKQSADLSKTCMENVVFSSNKVEGTIDLDSSKYLLLSIPYSKGWTAKVDGVSAEVLQANQHYIGLELTEGHHEIILYYASPGLKLGVIISSIAFLLFFLNIWFYKKKNCVRTVE